MKVKLRVVYMPAQGLPHSGCGARAVKLFQDTVLHPDDATAYIEIEGQTFERKVKAILVEGNFPLDN